MPSKRSPVRAALPSRAAGRDVPGADVGRDQPDDPFTVRFGQFPRPSGARPDESRSIHKVRSGLSMISTTSGSSSAAAISGPIAVRSIWMRRSSDVAVKEEAEVLITRPCASAGVGASSVRIGSGFSSSTTSRTRLRPRSRCRPNCSTNCSKRALPERALRPDAPLARCAHGQEVADEQGQCFGSGCSGRAPGARRGATGDPDAWQSPPRAGRPRRATARMPLPPQRCWTWTRLFWQPAHRAAWRCSGWMKRFKRCWLIARFRRQGRGMPAGTCAAGSDRAGAVREVVVIEQPEVGDRHNQVGVVGDGFGEFGLATRATVVSQAAEAKPSTASVAGATGTGGTVSPLQSSGRKEGTSA